MIENHPQAQDVKDALDIIQREEIDYTVGVCDGDDGYEYETTINIPDLLGNNVFKTILSCLEAQRAVPDDWVLVPKEPTEQMKIAGKSAFLNFYMQPIDQLPDDIAIYTWHEMITAAPKVKGK
jgi:hypothetical protein